MSGPTKRLGILATVGNRAPARTLSDAVKLCDPMLPLRLEDEALHINLDPARGGDQLAPLMRNIRRAGDEATLQFLSGHVGAGKTTELLRMAERLKEVAQPLPLTQGDDADPAPEEPRLTVLVLDGTPIIDIADVDLEDVLVLLWKVVLEQQPRAAMRVLPPLWKDSIVKTFGSIIVGLPEDLAKGLNKVLDVLKIQPPELRKKLRVELSNIADTLVEGLNLALEAVREDASGSVVLLLDNLEKLSERRRESVEHLYLERLGVLKRLNAHVIVTAPSYLAYGSTGGSLMALYGSQVVLLPMIKVRERQERGGGVDAVGVGLMKELLGARVDFARLFADGEAAMERVATASGGCIRHALRIVRAAVNEQDDAPIVSASLDRAIGSLQGDFDRALPEKWVPILKKVDEMNRFPGDCDEVTKREMLRHLFVLEYRNGEPESFYVVHPLVAQCRKFKTLS